jgi:excisionase family DNA binding protein
LNSDVIDVHKGTPRTKGYHEEKEDKVKALLRVCEVQEILNMGRTKIYDLIRAGVVPSIKIDGNIRVPTKPLYEWIEARIASAKLRASPESGTASNPEIADRSAPRRAPLKRRQPKLPKVTMST